MLQPPGDRPDESHRLIADSVAKPSSHRPSNKHQHVTFRMSQTQYIIPSRLIPQYDYDIAPMEPDDAAPHADRNLLSWRPMYLRIPVLSGFVVFFCLVIAAIEAMFQVSQHRQGLASSDQKLHYLWTYGPSAVLIITSAFWARVEYQSKELAPWRSMVGKEAEATKSVLLDYVSATAPMSVIYALGNRHYIVALIAICGLLMKVLIVFSTALLVLSPIRVDRENVPIVLTSTFGGSAADLNRTGTLPITMLSGIQEKGMQYPPGLTADLAYQLFTSPVNASDAVLGTSVEAFVGSLECEEAQLIVDSWYLISGPLIPLSTPPYQKSRMEFVTGDCRITDVTIDASERISTTNSSGYFGTMRPGWCNSSQSTLDMRLVVAMGVANPGVVTSIAQPQGTRYTNVTVSSSTQFICKPVYNMMTAHVTLNQTGSAMASVQSLSASNTPTPFTDLQGWNFLAIQYDDPQLSVTTSVQSRIAADLVDYRLLLAMKQADMSNTTYSQMAKGDNLVTAAKKFFGITSALYAHTSLRRPTNVTTTGTSQTIESRLQVKELPLRAMESILALITMSTLIVMAYLIRWQAVPRCPSTLLDLAALLTRSQGLLRLLEGTGAMDMAGLRTWLGGRRYSSGIVSNGADNYFCVGVSHQGLQSRQTLSTNLGNNKGWQPFTIRLVGRVLAGMALVFLIAVLELLLWYSRKHTGFSDVSLQGYIHYSWAYVPATVLILVSLWFSAIDFDLRCLSPYFGLKRGDFASRTIGLSYLDDLSGTTLLKSVKNRHWAVSTTSLASLVGSTLTIAVAGCFLTTNVPLDSTIQLQVNSWFNSESVDKFSSDQSTLDYGTTVASLVLYANLSYPAWTYDELALPKLSIIDQNNSAENSVGDHYNGEIRVRTVATRSNLNCTVLQAPQLNYKVNNGSLVFNVTNGKCRDTSLNGTPIKAGHFGMAFGGRFCFDEVFLWGRYDGGAISALSVAGCNETFNDVDVDVTLVSPSLAIAQPPLEHSSTLRESKAYNNDWRRMNLPTVAQANNSNLDPFFLAVVYGRDGISLSDLGVTGSASVVLDRIKHVISVVRAQYFGEYLRTTTNATNTPLPISANFTQYDRLRLVQDPISTRILESLLGIMLLCTIIGTAVQPNTRNMVPKNPCSIAAKASLLADSNLMTREFLPEDADRMSDEELEALAGRTKFGIGWFKALHADGSGKARVYKVEKLPPVLNDRITHDIAARQDIDVRKGVPTITITHKRW